MQPQMVDGIVTVLGIADDDTTPNSPYAQFVFDSAQYGVDTVAIEVGGFADS